MTEYLAGGGILVLFSKDENLSQLDGLIHVSNFILDGVLGTGMRLPLKGAAQAVLRHLKEMEELPYVIALDCPSGVDCDSGDADEAAIRGKLDDLHGCGEAGITAFSSF